MNRTTVRIVYDPRVPVLEVREALFMAFTAVECLYGLDRLRLELTANVVEQLHELRVAGSEELVQAVSRISYGILRREFGPDKIRVVHAPAESEGA